MHTLSEHAALRSVSHLFPSSTGASSAGSTSLGATAPGAAFSGPTLPGAPPPGASPFAPAPGPTASAATVPGEPSARSATSPGEPAARSAASRLAALLATEHASLADFVLALAEFDRRRLWVLLGHPSLFSFLRRHLGLSSGAAFLRSTAAGLLRRVPAVEAPLRDGRLCLSAVAELARVLTEQNAAALLPRFFHLSRREARDLAAALLPVAVVPRRDVVTRSPGADLVASSGGDRRRPIPSRSISASAPRSDGAPPLAFLRTAADTAPAASLSRDFAPALAFLGTAADPAPATSLSGDVAPATAFLLGAPGQAISSADGAIAQSQPQPAIAWAAAAAASPGMAPPPADGAPPCPSGLAAARRGTSRRSPATGVDRPPHRRPPPAPRHRLPPLPRQARRRPRRPLPLPPRRRHRADPRGGARPPPRRTKPPPRPRRAPAYAPARDCRRCHAGKPRPKWHGLSASRGPARGQRRASPRGSSALERATTRLHAPARTPVCSRVFARGHAHG